MFIDNLKTVSADRLHPVLEGTLYKIIGDLLFTAHSGRVDLPGSDPMAQLDSLKHARKLLSSLPQEWRLIPGHRYDWIDGTTPDWVTIEEALDSNFSLNDDSVTSSFV